MQGWDRWCGRWEAGRCCWKGHQTFLGEQRWQLGLVECRLGNESLFCQRECLGVLTYHDKFFDICPIKRGSLIAHLLPVGWPRRLACAMSLLELDQKRQLSLRTRTARRKEAQAPGRCSATTPLRSRELPGWPVNPSRMGVDATTFGRLIGRETKSSGELKKFPTPSPDPSINILSSSQCPGEVENLP